MKYNGLIQKKIALLRDYSSKLTKELKGVSFKKFKTSWAMQRMTERSLQVMVEIVIDIAERIIAIEKAGPVESAGKAIEKLVELKVLKSNEPYIDMVKFRNLVVHRYELIDTELLYSIVSEKLHDFDKYIGEIDECP